MTRESFIHSTDISDDDLLSAFERLMGLYGICGNVIDHSDITFIKAVSESSFDIVTTSSEVASKARDIWDGAHIRLYGNEYDIHCESMNDLIRVQLL